ncbi:MAG: cytochrome c [SAR324 cluster bacterium]|nr:cytochrome c [SAR324 cluster bacterium]
MFSSRTNAVAAEQTAIERGEYLFRATGGCGCHTNYQDEGAEMAGGRAIKTPFGDFYSTNITPDRETGIGKWSDDDFIKAMTEGIGPDGTHYAPVFPYTSFTKMSKNDLLDLKAYLFSIPPVRQKNQSHDLFIPFGERIGFGLWKKMNFTPGRFQPDPAKSSQWNRGAYLSRALAHCEECHTPRNLQGVLKKDMAYAGSVEGPEGELAPNITPDKKTGIGEWALVDIIEVLQSGLKPDGDDLQGLMGEVIEHGYSFLKKEDLEAIAFYLKSLPPIQNQVGEQKEQEE